MLMPKTTKPNKAKQKQEMADPMSLKADAKPPHMKIKAIGFRSLGSPHTRQLSHLL